MKSQEEHEKHNAVNYPGTRQMCAACDQPTGRCEDDSMYNENVGPLCMECVDYVNLKELEVAYDVAAINAAWIAKFGLPDVDPGTAARAAAKDKEWAEFLQAKAAAKEKPE